MRVAWLAGVLALSTGVSVQGLYTDKDAVVTIKGDDFEVRRYAQCMLLAHYLRRCGQCFSRLRTQRIFACLHQFSALLEMRSFVHFVLQSGCQSCLAALI